MDHHRRRTRYYGQPLLAERQVGPVRAMGIDETKWLSADHEHATRFVSSIVDIDRCTIVDLVEGTSSKDISGWCANQSDRFLRSVQVLATDLTESYRHGTKDYLDHTLRVADPFHVVRLANHALDLVRRRVQNQTLGHRGLKGDPLYRIRKLLAMGSNASTSEGRNGCSWAYDWVTLTERWREPGSPRSRCVTSI